MGCARTLSVASSKYSLVSASQSWCLVFHWHSGYCRQQVTSVSANAGLKLLPSLKTYMQWRN